MIGDARYGRPFAPAPPRMALHATRLGFAHPRTGAPLAFDSPWPPDLDGVDRSRVAQRGYAVTRGLMPGVHTTRTFFVIESRVPDGHYGSRVGGMDVAEIPRTRRGHEQSRSENRHRSGSAARADGRRHPQRGRVPERHQHAARAPRGDEGSAARAVAARSRAGSKRSREARATAKQSHTGLRAESGAGARPRVPTYAAAVFAIAVPSFSRSRKWSSLTAKRSSSRSGS